MNLCSPCLYQVNGKERLSYDLLPSKCKWTNTVQEDNYFLDCAKFITIIIHIDWDRLVTWLSYKNKQIKSLHLQTLQNILRIKKKVQNNFIVSNTLETWNMIMKHFQIKKHFSLLGPEKNLTFHLHVKIQFMKPGSRGDRTSLLSCLMVKESSILKTGEKTATSNLKKKKNLQITHVKNSGTEWHEDLP